MDVTLTINDRDFSERLSHYVVDQEITYPDVITTLDGTEHYGKTTKRDIIRFSLIPFDNDNALEDYVALTMPTLRVTYTVPWNNNQLKSDVLMKVSSNITAEFGISSWNGLRYYKGGTITLRAVRAE